MDIVVACFLMLASPEECKGVPALPKGRPEWGETILQTDVDDGIYAPLPADWRDSGRVRVWSIGRVEPINQD